MCIETCHNLLFSRAATYDDILVILLLRGITRHLTRISHLDYFLSGPVRALDQIFAVLLFFGARVRLMLCQVGHWL